MSEAKHHPLIGGPGSSLPFVIESFLSWSLCISCLSVSGYHYIVSNYLMPRIIQIRKRFFSLLQLDDNTAINNNTTVNEKEDKKVDLLEYWLPLTITSRIEMDSMTVHQRYNQLIKVLCKLGLLSDETTDCFVKEDDLIQTIRTNEICRRLVTLIMRPYHKTKSNPMNQSSLMTNILNEEPQLKLPQQLQRIWPSLLQLPTESTANIKDTNNNDFMISLILPAFREHGNEIAQKLKNARKNAMTPMRIEIIIVDAGGCTDLEKYLKQEHSNAFGFCRIHIHSFTSGGGRGPCLNFGAKLASGRILTFCHSDTTLPYGWDTSIIETLFPPHSSTNNDRIANSCAFSFGIDTSHLQKRNNQPSLYYPPGIKAVETTANIRSHLYSLPYGDQVLSVPSHIFHYIGGFPDQCLMEDYELVGLLRKRAAMLPHFLPSCNDSQTNKERLAIISGEPALCSPRRWQKFGVLYVTFMNSKFVNLYAGGLSADGLYQLYYGIKPPKREQELSPWEVDLMVY